MTRTENGCMLWTPSSEASTLLWQDLSTTARKLSVGMGSCYLGHKAENYTSEKWDFC